jgi:hypothetical protein
LTKTELAVLGVTLPDAGAPVLPVPFELPDLRLAETSIPEYSAMAIKICRDPALGSIFIVNDPLPVTGME